MTILGVVLAVVITTITFEGSDQSYRDRDFVVDGLRFSPMCAVKVHRHLDYPSGYILNDPSNNCGRSNPNPEWAGLGDIKIDRFGDPFTLLSLDSVAPVNLMEFLVRSSKGGWLLVDYGPTGTHSFTGDMWTDVLWIALNDTSDTHQKKHGWDNIRYSYSVYEPSTLELLGIAFAGLLLFWVTRKLGLQ